jgi:crotonobetainyl-CoA:carnitine CoA-transferase CaiB-like acyl-CoA transferase
MASLAGLRVLDLSRVLAGPFCSAILADHGAEVWKIEQPGTGDDTRAFGPPFHCGESTYFLSVNRNKRSLAVDLKHPAGLDLVRRLALQADVVIENFRPGTAERLGLGAKELRDANPRLVYCSLSGFGQTGPWRDKAGYDLAVQGLGGLQALTGDPSGPPTKVGTSIADLVTGLYAVQGILMALHRRSVTGRGDTVDVAMLDCVASLLTYQATAALIGGRKPRRAGNRHPSIVPYETFRCADGWLNIACGNDAIFRSFCGVVGQPWCDDPRFASNPDRVQHRAELVPQIQATIGDGKVQEWVARLEAVGVPCGPILEVEDVVAHEQVLARGMVVDVQHPVAGAVKLPGVAVKHEEAPGSVHLPPPTLGQHTRAVLADILALDDAQLDDLKAQGAIR